MKLNLLIINFILYFSILSNAQVNQKSFSDTTLWHMHSGFVWTEGSGGPLHKENFNSYRMIINDTVIQDTVYQLLYSCNSNFSIINISFMGYFKNINNTIFYGNDLDSMKLIYDYNLNIGDTFRFDSYNNFNDPTSYLVEVVNVDSIFVNDSYRKRILFEDFPDTNNYCNTNIAPCWVEGVGDYNYGLIFDYGIVLFCGCQPNGNSSLQCFSENGINIIGDCQISTDIMNDHLVIEKIEVFPNPSSYKINIRSSIEKLSCFELFNISGQRVLIKQLSAYEANINISKLKSGLYFFRTRTVDNKYQKGKLIIK